MKLSKACLIAIASIILFACGSPKVMTTHKTEATNFEASGNYTEATIAWQQYFDQIPVEQTTGVEFATAAKTAFKSGDEKLALNWFDQARYKNYSDAEMYITLAKIYRSSKNLSKELSALEFYTANFGDANPEVNTRLFEIFYEIDSYDKALQKWGKMDESSKSEEVNLHKYFLINKKQENSSVCDSVSLVLLDKNPTNIDALKWNAKKYYWLGENRYKRELAKYEENKTTRQYKILLKELDIATADLKQSLTYLEKIWELEQGKEYASYFASIYGRFGDEKKSKYYQGFMQ